ncbi:unnamed protein product [Amoebophrya sp. A25]|nr:unnamed protein product [Amoebophrya sp. A25]|eukprot:GSA25T00014137001.1
MGDHSFLDLRQLVLPDAFVGWSPLCATLALQELARSIGAPAVASHDCPIEKSLDFIKAHGKDPTLLVDRAHRAHASVVASMVWSHGDAAIRKAFAEAELAVVSSTSTSSSGTAKTSGEMMMMEDKSLEKVLKAGDATAMEIAAEKWCTDREFPQHVFFSPISRDKRTNEALKDSLWQMASFSLWEDVALEVSDLDDMAL